VLRYAGLEKHQVNIYLMPKCIIMVMMMSFFSSKEDCNWHSQNYAGNRTMKLQVTLWNQICLF